MIKYMPKSMTEFVTESDGDSHKDTIVPQGWSCLWCGGM